MVVCVKLLMVSTIKIKKVKKNIFMSNAGDNENAACILMVAISLLGSGVLAFFFIPHHRLVCERSSKSTNPAMF